MATEFGILYPLWDFAADEGRLLEQVVGDVGLDHLTIPVVTGAQTQFRFGSAADTPHFHTEGGWHYRTSAKTLAACALRPNKAKWFAGGDLLAQIRERGAALGLKLIVRLHVRAVRTLVDEERHLCQRNAWGQEVPFAGGCACNPDLRELLRVTLEDLRRYEPAGYEVVDWAPDTAEDRGANRPLAWNPAARHLLDICFCASCRQAAERANVDAEAAARSVREQLQRLVTADDAAQPAPWPDNPLLRDYVAVRAADCAAWLQRLTDGEGEVRRLLVRNLGEPALPNCAPWRRLTRLPASACSALRDPDAAERLRIISEAGAVALPVWRPAFANAADLVRLTAEIVRGGNPLLEFEGLTEAAPEAITWLKQAVRFARRG